MATLLRKLVLIRVSTERVEMWITKDEFLTYFNTRNLLD